MPLSTHTCAVAVVTGCSMSQMSWGAALVSRYGRRHSVISVGLPEGGPIHHSSYLGIGLCALSGQQTHRARGATLLHRN